MTGGWEALLAKMQAVQAAGWEALLAKMQAVQAAGWSAPRGLGSKWWEWEPWVQRTCTRERLHVVLLLIAALVLVKLLVSGASRMRKGPSARSRSGAAPTRTPRTVPTTSPSHPPSHRSLFPPLRQWRRAAICPGELSAREA